MRQPVLLLIAAALFALAFAGFRQLPTSRTADKTPPLPSLTELESCLKRESFEGRLSCYRPVLESHLAARGPRTVLADLDVLQQTQATFAAHCHDLAHVLGRYWIARGGTVAAGFMEGSNVCHSGFFHGMVERVIRGDEILASEPLHASFDELTAKVPSICTAEALQTESGNIRFQCLHGLGHAVVFSLGYRMPLALKVCDEMPDDWGRVSCHGGAFMENITGVERERRMLRSNDPHYPCSAVEARYRDSCYLMQTSWMLEDGMSWEEIVAACRAAEPHRLACFQSFGRDLSPLARQHGPGDYASRCAALRPDERSRCIQGAVFALADHTWDGRYAYPFCAVFGSQELRAECFSAAHGHLQRLLEQPVEKLAADCRTYAGGRRECLAMLEAAPAR